MSAPRCPDCSSALIDDMQCGETVCSACGIVVEQQMVDYGAEHARSSYEDKVGLARATGQTTYALHDLGVSSVIADTRKDCNGKMIPASAANVEGMRRQQKRIRVSTNRERRLVPILTRMTDACRSMSLPDNVLETACVIYRGFDPDEVKGRHVDPMAAATVYLACRRCDVVRSLEEICRSFCDAREARAKTKLAARYYRNIKLGMGAAPTEPVGMPRYISQIANITGIDTRVERLALEIASKTGDGRFADGKTPKGIAAAYLYVASILRGQSVLQRDVSSVAHVTEVTIRSRCKDLLSSYRLRITLAPA